MNNYGTNRANKRLLSSNNNDRYNFNNLTNQAVQSNNEFFYTPTENNWNMKKKRKLSGISFQKNNQERFGFPQVYTSGCPHNTANLYLNKKNFSFKKKDTTKQNNYYDKEKLYQNLMKLQTSLNVLNQKYQKQKMENDKQAKEIERQNKFLNYMNEKNLKIKNMEIYSNSNFYNADLYNSDNIYNNTNNIGLGESKPEDNILFKKEKERNDLIKNLTRTNDLEYESKKYIALDEQKYNLNSYNNSKKKFTVESLKSLYFQLYNECKEREKLLVKNEKEKDKYIEENDILKVANETLISNLKRQMKRIEADNDKKDLEIKTLKKNIKCSRYTELLKENEVLNFEMDKLKNKLNDALKLINDYKKQEEEIKKLYEVIKKKDFKIKALQLELITLSNNSDETTKKLQDEIIVKDKLLKRQERDMKRSAFEKYALMQGQSIDDINKNTNININMNSMNKINDKKTNTNTSLEMCVNDIIHKCPQLYQLYIEMKHKGINSSKNFNNEVLKKISDVINLNEAKIIYCDLLLNYFDINNSDSKAKEVIMNLADKEFTSNKSIYEIKNKQIRIFDVLFNKNNQQKSLELLKKYIDENNLEEVINRTLTELDRDKLGYVTFEEMKNVIADVGLNDFQEEILFLTKSEIFNRSDYINLLVLFNSHDNVDINKYVQYNKEEENMFDNINNNNPNIENNNYQNENNAAEIHDINDNNNENLINNNNENNNENLINNNNESNNENLINNNIESNNENPINNNNENPINNNNENNNEINNNQDVNNNNNVENENKDNNEMKEDSKKDVNENENNNTVMDELEKNLKTFVHQIKKEGASPINYISHLKESINVNNDTIDAINIIKLKEFLNSKNIELKDEELNLLQKQFKLIENDEQNNFNDFINYDMFGQKLLKIIQNDSDNDEDFLANIPKMEIGGMD